MKEHGLKLCFRLTECWSVQNNMNTDILIVGCGVAGLYCALNFPENRNILIVTKNKAQKSDSYLAQGGICVLRDEMDYRSFFDDTMKAGHYENNPDSVDIMIRSSQGVIEDLVSFGVRFEKDGEAFTYTREGAHSTPRILFHEDETGKEITSHLLEEARSRKNITLIENFTMVDLICDNNICYGIIGHDEDGNYKAINANYTVLATGGIGGLFEHSTNYRHLTGDSLALALKYDIKLQHIDYIQIHPTTLFTKKETEKEPALARILKGIICIFTEVLIAIDIAKMSMYIREYGLTQKRVYTTLFMILLAVIFLAVLAKQLLGKIKITAFCVVSVLVFCGIMVFGRTDAFIAKYNVNAYISGEHEGIDIAYLMELDETADEYIVKLLDYDGIDRDMLLKNLYLQLPFFLLNH